MSSETDDRANKLRLSVRRAYSAAAQRPAEKHPFPVGRAFAESLGYPPDVLAQMPSAAEGFAGVGDVSIFAALMPGMRVIDLGCGAGLDTLIAARRVGAGGAVVGIDFSSAMLERAGRAMREVGARNVMLCRADAENLPLHDASIDSAIVNGIFNLNPAREAIFAELARVIRPGGSVWAAELIVREALPPEVRASAANWFA